MSLPVRCFSCGKVLKPFEKFVELKDESNQDVALDEMGYRRICCRRMYLGHNPQIEQDQLLYDMSRRGQCEQQLSV